MERAVTTLLASCRTIAVAEVHTWSSAQGLFELIFAFFFFLNTFIRSHKSTAADVAGPLFSYWLLLRGEGKGLPSGPPGGWKHQTCLILIWDLGGCESIGCREKDRIFWTKIIYGRGTNWVTPQSKLSSELGLIFQWVARPSWLENFQWTLKWPVRMQLRDLSDNSPHGDKHWTSFAAIFSCTLVLLGSSATDVHTSTETFWCAVAKQSQGGPIKRRHKFMIMD